jgi:hypothetical protein
MFQFYPTLWAGAVRAQMPVRQYLLPASSWGRFIRQDGTIRPANLPASIRGCVIDPGAFDAARRGKYQYDFEQYLRWLFSFQKGQIAWAGMPDYCCAFCQTHPVAEHVQRSWFYEMAEGDPVRIQQLRTTFLAEMIWSFHRNVPWIWVPFVQGLSIEQYARHAQELQKLILDMKWWYGPQSSFRAGIGSLCRPLPRGELLDIIAAVSDALPRVSFHLPGVKLKTFQHMEYSFPDCVVSADSTEWHGLRKLIPYEPATERQVQDPDVGTNGALANKYESFEREKATSLIKAWKQSGASQMEYAYTIGLPAYEKAIETAFAKVRPTVLPWHFQLQMDSMSPEVYPDLYEDFRRLVDEERRSLAAIPYPEGFAWHFEHPNANDWFWA